MESYAKWRPGFDDNAGARTEAGAIGDAQVFRSGDDPWEVLVLVMSGAVKDPIFTDEPTVYFLHGV